MRYRLWKGRKVRIVARGKLLTGTYVRSERLPFGGNLRTPVFRVAGRRHLRGYECWWMPLSEAKRIERAHAAALRQKGASK